MVEDQGPQKIIHRPPPDLGQLAQGCPLAIPDIHAKGFAVTLHRGQFQARQYLGLEVVKVVEQAPQDRSLAYIVLVGYP
jgi:hypothetical protein